MQLLTHDTNTKLAKTNKAQTEYMFIGLSLMPNKIICPASKAAGCFDPCLVSSGLGQMTSVAKARQAKTDFFMTNQAGFMEQIVVEMKAYVRRATKRSLKLACRMNVFSDIAWENIPVTVDGIVYENLMKAFPMVQFYDYTKRADRLTKKPAEYDLTFSYSSKGSYKNQIKHALKAEARMAVVFAGEFPLTFMGRKVIDGDAQDARFLESQGVIVGLKAKGKAKHNDNGFVART